jgi:DNA-directed RNA polymerase specialized sigma subunit
MLSYWDNSVYCSPMAHDHGRGPTHWGNVIDPSQDASAGLSDFTIARAVRDFIATLSPRDQDVVRRVFWDGERQAEVARAIGVSRMAVTKIMQKVARLGRTRLSDFQSFSLN